MENVASYIYVGEGHLSLQHVVSNRLNPVLPIYLPAQGNVLVTKRKNTMVVCKSACRVRAMKRRSVSTFRKRNSSHLQKDQSAHRQIEKPKIDLKWIFENDSPLTNGIGHNRNHAHFGFLAHA